MNNTVIVVLALILLFLIILNHLSINVISSPENQSPNQVVNQGNCSQTNYGCCPDGVNSKMNFYGTNCPKYGPV